MKRGLYFATTTVVMVFLIVFGYNVINENQKEEMGTTDFGKHAFGIIEKNIEAENLKFFIEENVKISKEIALKNVKGNAGVYDVETSNCEKESDYVIVTSECDYFSGSLAFEKSFNDTFNEFLRQHGDLDPKNFVINFENSILGVSGNKEIDLEIIGEKKENNEGLIETEFNNDLDNNILELVATYSEINRVPEELVRAIIVQESGGRVDSVNVNRDEEGNIRSTDHGIMQINDRAHPKFFDNTREDFVCDASRDIECNIRAGAEILKGSFDAYKDGRMFTCNGKFYTGWDAALRGYNGWGCTGNNHYVEDVMERMGEDVYFAVTKDVQIINVGTITINIDIKEEVEYDFNRISNVIVMGLNIKNCADNGGSIDICAARGSDLDYTFNVEEIGDLLKFDVEEYEGGDIIKFALKLEEEDIIT